MNQAGKGCTEAQMYHAKKYFLALYRPPLRYFTLSGVFSPSVALFRPPLRYFAFPLRYFALNGVISPLMALFRPHTAKFRPPNPEALSGVSFM